jgi:hypothetical protein
MLSDLVAKTSGGQAGLVLTPTFFGFWLLRAVRTFTLSKTSSPHNQQHHDITTARATK